MKTFITKLSIYGIIINNIFIRMKKLKLINLYDGHGYMTNDIIQSELPTYFLCASGEITTQLDSNNFLRDLLKNQGNFRYT
jgi:hypothetical protein